MSRVQVSPNLLAQLKQLAARVGKLERVASTTTLKDVNTTGLTSAQIDVAVFSGTSTPSTNAQAADGLIISDKTNGLLLVRQNGTWMARASMTAGDLIPSAAVSRAGCLLCDGGSYLRTSYPSLFAAIGTTYGSVDGSHFNVPDLRGRLPIGAGTGTGAGATAWALGSQPTSGAGGEQTHTLTAGESGVPAHSHGVNDPGHTHSVNTTWANTVTTTYASGSNTFTQTGYASQTTSSNPANISIQNNTSANASSPHNNLPPVSVINWFIVH